MKNKFPISLTEMRNRFSRLYSGVINDVLRFNYQLYTTSLPSEYKPLYEDVIVSGSAFTVKGVPDITTDGDHEMRAEMLESLYESSIVVWDCTGDTATSQWGEMMTMAAKRAGCVSAIINGIRDVQFIKDQAFPVYYKYKTTAGMLGRFRLYHYQKPIKIGDVIVHPGDWIFGDINGILSIPQDIAFDVLLATEKIMFKEEEIRAMIRSGDTPTEVVKKGGYF